MIKSQLIEYQDNGVTLEAYMAYQDNSDKPRPAVLVCHDWTGKNTFACNKANQLAELGYVGFAIDMFGKGVLGQTKEEKSALIQPFVKDRRLLLQRIMAGFDAMKSAKLVDSNKLGAIGFCFGGLCVLDLARSGTALAGVASFHGLLNPPNLGEHPIKAKILAMTGYDDPMVPPDVVNSFAQEMTKAKANWEIDIYGNTLHAFTNPEANDSSFGTVYNKQADQRSFAAMTRFFVEAFA